MLHTLEPFTVAICDIDALLSMLREGDDLAADSGWWRALPHWKAGRFCWKFSRMPPCQHSLSALKDDHRMRRDAFWSNFNLKLTWLVTTDFSQSCCDARQSKDW